MMNIIRRCLKWLGLSLLSLITLLILILWWVLFTESGTGWTIKQARPYLPEFVQVGQVKGALARQIDISDFVLQGPTEVSIQQISLRWQLSALLEKKLLVHQLQVNDASIRPDLTPSDEPPPASEPFSMPQAIELPVDIIIEQLALENIAIELPDQPIAIEHLRVSAKATSERFEITTLSLASNLANAELSAQLTPFQPYALNLDASWLANIPNYPAAQGQTRVAGDLALLQLNQSIDAPYSLAADMELSNPIDDLGFDGWLSLTDVKTQQIDASIEPVTITTKVSLQGKPTDLQADIDGRITPENYPTIQLTSQLNWKDSLLSLHKLHIKGLEQPLEASVQGTVNVTNPTPELDLSLQWSEIRWPLEGETMDVASKQGSATFKGTPDTFITALNAQLSNPQYPSGQLRLAGKSDNKKFALEQLTMQALGGEIHGTGLIDYGEPFAADLKLTTQTLNPGLIAKEFAGSINAAINTSIRMHKDKYHVQLKQLDAHGELRGYPLKLSAKADIKPELITLNTANLRLGTANIEASGTIADKLDIKWLADVKELRHLLPQARGKLYSKGHLSGQQATPNISAEAQGEQLFLDGITLDSLSLTSELSLDESKPSSVSVRLSDLRANAFHAESLTLDLNGLLNQHDIVINLDSNQLIAELKLAGQWFKQQQNWAFTLNQGSLQYPETGAWHLAQPASGEVSATQQRIDKQCWQNHQASLCLNASQQQQRVLANVQLSQLPIDYFEQWLPNNVRISTALNMTLNTDYDLNQPLPELQAAISLDKGTVIYQEPNSKSPPQRVQLLPSNIDVSIAEQNIVADAKINLPQQDFLQARLSIPPTKPQLEQRPLQGQIHLQVKDMTFIDQLVDPIDKLQGVIEASAVLAGTVAAPTVEGNLRFEKGRLRVLDAGLDIKDIDMALSGSPQDGADIKLTARSNEGTLALEGTSNVDPNQLTVDAKLSGNGFRVLNKRKQKVDISPNLTVAMANNEVHVNGEVVIPYADISNIDSGPPTGVSVSNDQIIVKPDSEVPKKENPIKVFAQVRVKMGEEVYFEDQGLEARFGGNIVVIEKPGQVTSASGEFRIEKGRFRRLGQDLVIRKGRVIFAGPVTEPGLDIEAVRVINDQLVTGIRARGPLSQLDQFSLFSDPGGLSQAEILSYITTGRSLSGSSEGEASAMAQVSMALAMTGGKYLTDNFGHKLGVDDIGIDTEPGQDTSQAALTVGKYLSPKLYVSYGIGLFEPVSTVKMRYSINDKWKFVTESSGETSGADFIYQIESGY